MLHFIIPKNTKKAEIIVLINFKSKVNTINFAYTAKLHFMVQKADINTRKINGLSLKPYDIDIAAFFVFNKLDHLRFLKRHFIDRNQQKNHFWHVFFDPH